MPRTLIVIPCYNEALRLLPDELLTLAATPDVDVLLVDDGSKDGTRAVQESIAARSGGRITVLGFDTNRGKGEAVRAGLSEGRARGYDVVGFLDADLATPISEMVRLVAIFSDRYDVVLASRVALSGSDIKRRARRHYLGRVFSTFASLMLGAMIYDTQCGAKLFRVDDRLSAALAEPFHSRWAFDVELLGRLLGTSTGHAPLAPERILEVPLQRWHEIAGSKVDARAMLITVADLVKIGVALRRG